LIYPQFSLSFKLQLGIVEYNNRFALIADNGILLDLNGVDYYESFYNFIKVCQQSKF
jgi:hypothetical protein